MELNRFKEITTRFADKKVLVVGDLMLDTYLWGHADRISPEAPVPVVKVNKIEHNPGGAANVALNLASLGCKVSIIGLIGADSEGKILTELLDQRNIVCTNLVESDNRPTTVKSRIMAHNQQVVRADREENSDLSESSNKALAESVDLTLKDVDAIILEDYNKGVLNSESINTIILMANETGKPVYVDPKKANFNTYKNVRLFKPNLNEFRQAYAENESLEVAGFRLKNELNAEILMITRGAEGVSLFDGSDYHHIPTKARRVHDVSGAGDTVISTFALADLCGATPEESVTLSNYAAGRVCEEVGVVPISLDLLNEMLDHHNSI
ncbi:MAG: D-glycero-beta-D-manno-heptose-7-phosphate kinase [Candidatus Marinimicrobia bacterium]|mgnify:CR=1 FL=1|jgi:rfaE bifunctional protein kinase chain/domain|nr:D-glycero-beta-D-manno-heptose-7-phosphate kinase [Candidatus Neomarinimicrobiota bacterium]MBT4269948.1 D-glycero-beta-D-manno-heptose-7-phosphate kinase [Candidatus Neomarinimicrobiota bacterium]MBT4808306.1 D-glycero-beta-D-manno-heptose-7-phosphate kinase [Candidatus Neomarinimicrobiota bacterium]MBT5176022.1 D-glycero-beta-D-manno-heptose-7-phosphate kinase [Candidatus Neomarinimicrobiota bacterium]MBT6418101.1 D-glycero-beta-D-manno-heptose-7-phosphate kinase [Candidatus Neomarinimicro